MIKIGDRRTSIDEAMDYGCQGAITHQSIFDKMKKQMFEGCGNVFTILSQNKDNQDYYIYFDNLKMTTVWSKQHIQKSSINETNYNTVWYSINA